MKTDSYWHVIDENIKPVCIECHADSEDGWYWPKEKGYGNWDIHCSLCGKIINQIEDRPNNHEK